MGCTIRAFSKSAVFQGILRDNLWEPTSCPVLQRGPIIEVIGVNTMIPVVTSLADLSIFGAVVDERYNGESHVTIVATGFSQTYQKSLIDPKAAKQMEKRENKLNPHRNGHGQLHDPLKSWP